MKTLLRIEVEQWVNNDPSSFITRKDDFEIDLFNMNKSFNKIQEKLNEMQETNERHINEFFPSFSISKTVKRINIENHVE